MKKTLSYYLKYYFFTFLFSFVISLIVMGFLREIGINPWWNLLINIPATVAFQIYYPRIIQIKLPDLFWMWFFLAGIALVVIPTLIYCAHKVLTAFNL